MRLVCISLAVALAAAPVAAQQLIPPLAAAPGSFDFSFSNPGARSLGFGGAFVALADDATAAFANPAGLVKLERPEVSVEVRHWGYSTPYLAGGRLSGSPTGLGVDTATGIARDRSEEETNALSFASFVYPHGRWSLALYQHQQVDFASRVETTALFGHDAVPFAPRYPDISSRTDSTIRSFGAALGFRFDDHWSGGIGLSYFDVDLATHSGFYFPSRPTPDQLFGALPHDDAHLGIEVTLLAEDEHDWGWHGGVLWQPTEQWGVGAFYRQGAAFPLVIEARSGAGLPTPPGAQTPPVGTLLSSSRVDPLRFPDVYGLGASWRASSGAVTLSFEWDRVEYSTILESFDRTFDGTGGVLDDADELHFGGEYAFLGTTPVIALRAGAWLDPDHQVRPEDDETTSPDAELLRAIFAAGEDQWHYAIGAGVAFERLQIDLAADFSDRVDTLSLSGIWTF